MSISIAKPASFNSGTSEAENAKVISVAKSITFFLSRIETPPTAFISIRENYRSYVDSRPYQYYFQKGFERGYQDEYNSRYQHGSNRFVQYLRHGFARNFEHSTILKTTKRFIKLQSRRFSTRKPSVFLFRKKHYFLVHHLLPKNYINGFSHFSFMSFCLARFGFFDYGKRFGVFAV